MNENINDNGKSEIPEVEELVIEDGDDIETIRTKTTEHNQKVKDWKSKVDESNKQLYARTKKSEGFELVDGKWVKPQTKEEKETKDTSKNSQNGLTSEDVLVIVENKIPKEDIKDVAEYAKFKGITMEEAIKSPVLQSILKDNLEKRKTAEGANTDSARRGSSRLSDDALLANARAGKMPDNAEDMSRLTILQRGKK